MESALQGSCSVTGNDGMGKGVRIRLALGANWTAFFQFVKAVMSD